MNRVRDIPAELIIKVLAWHSTEVGKVCLVSYGVDKIRIEDWEHQTCSDWLNLSGVRDILVFRNFGTYALKNNIMVTVPVQPVDPERRSV